MKAARACFKVKEEQEAAGERVTESVCFQRWPGFRVRVLLVNRRLTSRQSKRRGGEEEEEEECRVLWVFTHPCGTCCRV